MDDSFNSCSSFDGEEFFQDALKTPNNENNGNFDVSMETTTKKSTKTVNISSFLMSVSPPNLNVSITPKNARKRSFSRRCLSVDLFSDDRSTEVSPKYSKLSVSSAATATPLSNSPILNTSERREMLDRFDNGLTPEFADSEFRRRPRFRDSNCLSQGSNMPKAKNVGFPLKKCFSEIQASNIMKAVQISSTDATLIGDCSKPYALPTLKVSKHSDLRSISHTTLAELMAGKYNDSINKFTVIDCRFPYEYEGGHIKSAVNIYTQEDILKTFISNQENAAEIQHSTRRDILIFHCEFSSERGPSLYRFLRNTDRAKNVYPCLHYPEVYLLEGGYKDFFMNHKELCTPETYVPMHSKEFDQDQKKYRQIMKENSFDSKNTVYKQRSARFRFH